MKDVLKPGESAYVAADLRVEKELQEKKASAERMKLAQKEAGTKHATISKHVEVKEFDKHVVPMATGVATSTTMPIQGCAIPDILPPPSFQKEDATPVQDGFVGRVRNLAAAFRDAHFQVVYAMDEEKRAQAVVDAAGPGHAEYGKLVDDLNNASRVRYERQLVLHQAMLAFCGDTCDMLGLRL
jgi:hypothetical protein